jgi:hypothetical protein
VCAIRRVALRERSQFVAGSSERTPVRRVICAQVRVFLEPYSIQLAASNAPERIRVPRYIGGQITFSFDSNLTPRCLLSAARRLPPYSLSRRTRCGFVGFLTHQKADWNSTVPGLEPGSETEPELTGQRIVSGKCPHPPRRMTAQRFAERRIQVAELAWIADPHTIGRIRDDPRR